ncbi:HAD family hydrolase [Methylophilus flavus]|uniref:HAD family hydrolase n=1 Tax=Methylophilus flavus TaxID=640084 RepID=A0ABW3PBF6_9PROT
MNYLLWDFDGTLAERPGLWSQCLADVVNENQQTKHFQRHHFSPHLSTGFPWHTPEITHEHILTAEAWWENLESTLIQALVKGAQLSLAEATLLIPNTRMRYIDPTGWQVYEDTVPTLKQLSKDGWQHLILSNHVPELPALVESLGLTEHFQSIYTSAITGFEKPNPAAFQYVLKQLPQDANVIMIGDSYEADVLGAQSIGLAAILVRNHHAEMPELLNLHKLPDILRVKLDSATF